MKRKILKYVLLTAGICLYSCTGVNLGTAKDPEGSSLTFVFDFSKAKKVPPATPDNMEVFMSELLNGGHYRFNKETGFVISKEGEFPIKGGEYAIMSIGGDSTGFEITGADSFLDPENPSGLDQLCINLNILSDREVAERYCHGLNYMASPFFSVPPVSVLYLADEKNYPIYFTESGEQVQVTLTPVETGISLNFSIKLQVEDSITVDSVFAGISGVPIQLRLSDGTVKKDSLGKSFFRMIPDSTRSHRYTGNVMTWGLFSSEKENERNGAGVLWISATVSYNGKTVVYGAGTNLKRMIDSIGIMTTDDRTRWKPAKTEASFAIGETYFISKEMVLSSGQDRLDEWIQKGYEKDSIIVEL